VYVVPAPLLLYKVTLVFGQIEGLTALSVVFKVNNPTVVQAEPKQPTLLALTQY
jgi:hypothetical protein